MYKHRQKNNKIGKSETVYLIVMNGLTDEVSLILVTVVCYT